MSASEKTQEQISAFADGELDDPYIANVLASLRKEEYKDDWELYHQIGDVLRSNDMAVSMSSGFAARMAERLEKEPTIIAPTDVVASPSAQETQSASLIAMRNAGKRWALPGMAAAVAVAAIAFVTTPHLMVAMNKSSDATLASTSAETASIASNTVTLRDPRIDDYLLAHQQFSPSVYSTAQYARLATFASDSGK